MERKNGKNDGDELYRRFLDGDAAALSELVILYRESLILFIYGYVKDIVEAEDLAADAFARLVVSRGQFRGMSTPKTYLFAIGRNLALRHLKKRRREKTLPLEDAEADAGAYGISPEISLLREERDRRLFWAMQEMKPEHREVLYFIYFEDMSYAETGMALNKSETQIANLLYRAKASLKKKLESEGFPDDEP